MVPATEPKPGLMSAPRHDAHVFPPLPAPARSRAPPLAGLHARALLARFAGPFPSSLSSSPLASLDPSDRFATAEALSYRDLPSPLADALGTVTRLGTPIGREAILELLGNGAADFHGLPPVDLAVRVLCARGIDPRVARAILKRALIRVARHFSPRHWYTLLWPRRELPSSPDALLEAARAVHGEAFVRGWLAGVTGGVLRVIVLHRAPAERSMGTPLATARARGRRAPTSATSSGGTHATGASPSRSPAPRSSPTGPSPSGAPTRTNRKRSPTAPP